MPLVVSITSPDLEAVSKALKGVTVNRAPQRAIQDAIRRSLTAGQAAVSQSIRSRYNIAAATIKGDIEVKQASFINLTGSINIKGPMLPIEAFKPTVVMKSMVKKGPKHIQNVRVTIIKGQRKLVRGAFMIPSGRVMERRQPERFPIFRVHTIGIPYMARQTGIVDTIQTRMNEVYNSRLEANISAMLGGFWQARGRR